MHDSPLLSELERIARERAWSPDAMARTIGLTRTGWLHLLSGRRLISRATLSRIAVTFGQLPSIRHLVWSFLISELPAREKVALTSDARAAEGEGSASRAVRGAIREYATTFATENLQGRGLFLFGEAALLSDAVRLLALEFAQRRVVVMVLPASRRPTASEARDALAAPLLVIERVEHLSEPMRGLLSRRFEVRKPVAASSTVPRERLADPIAARILRASTRIVSVRRETDPPAIPPPADAPASSGTVSDPSLPTNAQPTQ